MNTINVTRFHEEFDVEADAIIERARESLLEGPGTVTRETLVAQIIMEEMFAHPLDDELTGREYDALTTNAKKSLVEMASHMGPDYAQYLYRAAVFITKVA